MTNTMPGCLMSFVLLLVLPPHAPVVADPQQCSELQERVSVLEEQARTMIKLLQWNEKQTAFRLQSPILVQTLQ